VLETKRTVFHAETQGRRVQDAFFLARLCVSVVEGTWIPAFPPIGSRAGSCGDLARSGRTQSHEATETRMEISFVLQADAGRDAAAAMAGRGLGARPAVREESQDRAPCGRRISPCPAVPRTETAPAGGFRGGRAGGRVRDRQAPQGRPEPAGVPAADYGRSTGGSPGRSCFRTCEATGKRSFVNAGRSMGSVRGSAIRGEAPESIACESRMRIPGVRASRKKRRGIRHSNPLRTPAIPCRPPLMRRPKMRLSSPSQRIARVRRILEWAVQDSNLRLSACKADALAD
jgi:hypothetical protein